MSEVTAILEEIEKILPMEFGSARVYDVIPDNPMPLPMLVGRHPTATEDLIDSQEDLLKRLQSLLSTHAVIDKETAENISYELDHEGLIGLEAAKVKAELTRLTDSEGE